MTEFGLDCRTIGLLMSDVPGTTSFLLPLGSSALAHLSQPVTIFPGRQSDSQPVVMKCLGSDIWTRDPGRISYATLRDFQQLVVFEHDARRVGATCGIYDGKLYRGMGCVQGLGWSWILLPLSCSSFLPAPQQPSSCDVYQCVLTTEISIDWILINTLIRRTQNQP